MVALVLLFYLGILYDYSIEHSIINGGQHLPMEALVNTDRL